MRLSQRASPYRQFSRLGEHTLPVRTRQPQLHLRDGVPTYASPHTVHLQPLHRGAKDPRCTPRQQLTVKTTTAAAAAAVTAAGRVRLKTATTTSPLLHLSRCGRHWQRGERNECVLSCWTGHNILCGLLFQWLTHHYTLLEIHCM